MRELDSGILSNNGYYQSFKMFERRSVKTKQQQKNQHLVSAEIKKKVVLIFLLYTQYTYELRVAYAPLAPHCLPAM